MKKAWFAFVMTMGLCASPALAAPIGPNFLLDVGDFAGVGTTGTGSGRTITYTGLSDDYGSFADVWFGVYNINGPLSSASGSGTSQSFGITPTIIGNTATWTGPSLWNLPTTSGTFNLQVRYSFSVTDLSNNPIPLLDASTIAGLAGSGGAVFDVDPYMGTGFKTTQLFSALSGATWIPVDTLFDSYGTFCSNCVQKSTNGGFWYEPAPAAVPEPASLALLGTGLAFSARTLRNRRRKNV